MQLFIYIYFLFSTVLLLLLNKVHVISFKIFILTILFSDSNLKLCSIHKIVVIDARNSFNGFSIIFINNRNTIHQNDCSRKMIKKQTEIETINNHKTFSVKYAVFP